MAQAAAAANRILSFRVRDKENRKTAAELQDADGGVKIELKDVWFKYPTRDTPIFTGLNLQVEKGQFAALVGPSGQLLLKFWRGGPNICRLWKDKHSFSSRKVLRHHPPA